jgi:hypothetical protein
MQAIVLLKIVKNKQVKNGYHYFNVVYISQLEG